MLILLEYEQGSLVLCIGSVFLLWNCGAVLVGIGGQAGVCWNVSNRVTCISGNLRTMDETAQANIIPVD